MIIREPSLKIEYESFRDQQKPCLLQLYLHQKTYNIDSDSISGYIYMKEIDDQSYNKVRTIRLDLIQQEIQGSTKSQPLPGSAGED